MGRTLHVYVLIHVIIKDAEGVGLDPGYNSTTHVVDQNMVCVCQVVSQYSSQLAPIAVDAVMRVVDPARDTNVNLKDIKIVKKLGSAFN